MGKASVVVVRYASTTTGTHLVSFIVFTGIFPNAMLNTPHFYTTLHYY